MIDPHYNSGPKNRPHVDFRGNSSALYWFTWGIKLLGFFRVQDKIHRMTLRIFFLTIFLFVPIKAAEWPEFRGPNAQGVVEAKAVPSKMGNEVAVVPAAERPAPRSMFVCYVHAA